MVSRSDPERCCFWGSWARILHVALGKHNLKNWEATQQVVRVVRQVRHPHYNSRTHNNDLMLLRLERPVRLGRAVKPIAVASTCMSPGTPCLVSGWGTTSSPIGKSFRILERRGWGTGLLGLREEEANPARNPSVYPQPGTPTPCSA